MISQLFITSQVLAELTIEKKKNSIINRNAIEISIGKFHPGPYAPYQIDKEKWNKCNTLNFCNLKNLFGKNIGLTYIKRYYEKKNHKIDIDSSIILNSQKYRSTKNNFFIISVIPTYRYETNKLDKRITLGVGAGISIASGEIPLESNDNENLNTQLNLEIAYRINKKTSSEIVMGIKHRCSLFGVIGGKLRGSQWYTIGIRQWL